MARGYGCTGMDRTLLCETAAGASLGRPTPYGMHHGVAPGRTAESDEQ